MLVGTVMSSIESAALAIIGVLTLVMAFVLVLVIRQIGLLTIRVSNMVPHMDLSQDGLDIGQSIPEGVKSGLPMLANGTHYILVLSGTCVPCRHLANDIRQMAQVPEGGVALIAGRAPVAEELRDVLPTEITSVVGPEASELAEALDVRSTPFGFYLVDGVIAAKSPLQAGVDLLRLIDHGGDKRDNERLQVNERR